MVKLRFKSCAKSLFQKSYLPYDFQTVFQMISDLFPLAGNKVASKTVIRPIAYTVEKYSSISLRAVYEVAKAQTKRR